MRHNRVRLVLPAALALSLLGCTSEDKSFTASPSSDPAASTSPVARVTQARRDCDGADNATLVGQVTGVPDGAAVEVFGGDGKHRGTAAVTDGAFEVFPSFAATRLRR